jgi:hypothetical protein
VLTQCLDMMKSTYALVTNIKSYVTCDVALVLTLNVC